MYRNAAQPNHVAMIMKWIRDLTAISDRQNQNIVLRPIGVKSLFTGSYHGLTYDYPGYLYTSL